MVPFKIYRGNYSDLPVTLSDGYAYFCVDTGELFVDYTDFDGTLKRKQTNADGAKSILGYRISDVLNDNASEIPTSSSVCSYVDAILQVVYPIGSIYLSVTETNPLELFGFGEWEQIKDTFLLAAGDTYTAGETGGEAEHTLTIEEMPEHRHQLKTDISNDAYNQTWPEWFEYTDGWTQEANETESPATHTTYTGGSQSHNNMPPYLTVFVWKRVY